MVGHTMPYGPRREKTCLRGLRTTRRRKPVDLLQAKFHFLAIICSRGDWFESRFVGNPENRFCSV